MSALVDIESDQRVSSRGSQEKRMGTVVMRRIDQAQFLSRIIPPQPKGDLVSFWGFESAF